MKSLNVPALAPVSEKELSSVEGGRFIFRRICVRFRIIRIFVRDRFPFRGGFGLNNGRSFNSSSSSSSSSND